MLRLARSFFLILTQASGGQALVGIGPSGSGKTRLLFDIASRYPALYFECVGLRVGQADTSAFSKQVMLIKNVSEEERTFKAAYYLRCLITARLLLMEQYAVHVKQKNIGAWTPDVCRCWLMVQLNGETKISPNLFLALIRGDEAAVNIIRYRCMVSMQALPMFLFDEAHGWHNERTYGTFLTTTNDVAPSRERRTLFTRAVFVLRQLGFMSLWVGTALSIGDLQLVQSALLAASTDGLLPRIVAGFRALPRKEVGATLRHFMGISAATVELLAGELAGRGRLTSEFVVFCWSHKVRTDDDVLHCFDRFRASHLSVTDTIDDAPEPTGHVRTLSGAWERLFRARHAGTARPSLRRLCRGWH